ALVRRRYVQGRAVAVRDRLGVAPVPGARQDDRRLALRRELLDLGRRRERIEQQQAHAVVDRVRRDQRPPPLPLVPLRVSCLPVPDAGSNLAHGPMLRNGIGGTGGLPQCQLWTELGVARTKFCL